MPRIVLKEIESEKSLAVSETEGVIGRDPACGFVIEGPSSKVVSGRHARIFFQDNGWWIEDTSRNGTVLDDERLQRGQRHAIRVGQLIGLGESGPRYRVVALDANRVPETVLELPSADAIVGATGPAATKASANVQPETTPMRISEAIRAGVRFEESTEPMSPAPDWLVQITLRATATDQHHEVRAQIVTIGRSPECNIQIPAEVGPSVSRTHAEITIQDGGVVVRDAGSRNGTFVNGKRISAPHPAVRGDLVMLGSGGPTFSIEDLHIVRGETRSADGKAARRSPDAGARAARLGVEPPTRPSYGAHEKPAPPTIHRSYGGKGKTAFFKDLLEDMSQRSARKVRIIVWASVAATVIIATILMGVTQWRVAESEKRITSERAQIEARSDSIRKAAAVEAERLRAAFDSARASSAPRLVVDSLRDALADAARRTGVLEQALVRARQSLDQQLAAGDSARRRAEDEMTRLRSEMSRVQAGDGSRAGLDSLRRALKDAEDRANDVAQQMRAVRGSNLAQVAQMNQGAVGLLFFFFGPNGDSISTGSGFAITPSGYFVTNRHVVTDRTGNVHDTIYIAMADQPFNLRTRVDVVALGADVDLAILKIPEYRGPYIKKIDWQGEAASQGAPAALIGFPYGTGLAFDDTASRTVRTSMTAGIFSKVANDFVQTNLMTVGGSSGSPIFSSTGEVVAVHRAGVAGGPGLGFGVPVTMVLKLLPAEAKSELGLR